MPASIPNGLIKACVHTYLGCAALIVAYNVEKADWREKRALSDAFYKVQGVTPGHDDNKYVFTPTQRSMFK